MLSRDAEILQKIGFNPYYGTERKGFIDMASNDYLGLRNHPHAIAKAKEAMDEYGLSACGTPIACGYSKLFAMVEERLSQFVGVEGAILFPSCYQANNGVFSVLCDQNDLIVFDKSSHSSLLQGIFSSKAKKNPFKHNDMEHLETILKRSLGRYNKIYIVTESVFSTEGAIAPLDKIMELCDKYNAIPFVDDSHGIGVIGANGKGVLEYFECNNFNGIYTASLGKALANSGGMIGGKLDVIQRLRYYCSHLIYSTAIIPSVLGGINGILDVYATEFAGRSKKLWGFKKRIQSCNNMFMKSEAPINSLFCGEREKAIQVAKLLFENKILSTPFVEPSVPKNECVVRLIANAGLTDSQVDKVCEVLCDIS